MLRYLTSGESHGRNLTAIFEGIPAGLCLSESDINEDLSRRQLGYGRGARMSIEKDRVEITSGVRHGRTTGAPIGLLIPNRDWENWKEVMSVDASFAGPKRSVTEPRPGHADLSAGLKYNFRDLRDALERSSARETAARVSVGAVSKAFLREFGINIASWVTQIGGAKWSDHGNIAPLKLFKTAEGSDVRCPDKKASSDMRRAIDEARENGDSIGGVFEVLAFGVPPGLGSHIQWDKKLDGRLARALMSIQAIKGVEAGIGFKAAELPGSKVHDEIFYRRGKKPGLSPLWPLDRRFFRRTNNAGGIEGGMSNGEAILLRAVMKPIPTLYRPLMSVDINTKKSFKASVERSDVCAVPAASVVGEAAIAFELADAFMEKFGGDSIAETTRNFRGYLKQLAEY